MVYRWRMEALRKLREVEPHEVSQALAAARRMLVSAVSPEGIRVLTLWARTMTGRPLIVALRRTGQFDHDIIGAREMTAAELGRFQQWEQSEEGQTGDE